MFSLVMIEEIESLLKSTDLSQRQVAMRLGISRGTVAAVARGKHSARRQRSAGVMQPRAEQQRTPQIVPDRDGAPLRCPGCGCRVFLPCLECHLRKLERARLAIRRLGRKHNVSRQALSESGYCLATDRRGRGTTVSNDRMGAGDAGKLW